MSLLLPLPGSEARELFDVADLAARRWVTLADARSSARRLIDGTRVRSATFLVIRADDSIELIGFGPKLGRKTLWRFGKIHA